MNRHLNLTETDWQKPENIPELQPNEVHLWRLPLADTKGKTALLTEEEKQRFARMHFTKDRAVRTTTRTRLRELLGAYTNTNPTDIRLAYATHGKPYLPDFPALGFNVSHAGDWAVIAFAAGLEIGVDTEETDRSFRVESLAGRFFSRLEVPVILGLPEAERHRAFYLAWTRKEAIIKARGDGLRLPLNEFGVSILGEEPVRVLHTDWREDEYRRWRLRSFTVAEDYPGAVAWLGEERIIRFFQ